MNAPAPIAEKELEHRAHWHAMIERTCLSHFRTLHVLTEAQELSDLPTSIRTRMLEITPEILDRCIRAHSEHPTLARKVEQHANRLLWDELKKFRRAPPWPDQPPISTEGYPSC